MTIVARSTPAEPCAPPRGRGIPTLYRGYRFRSRLEARWACFFDGIGWPWEYEPLDLNGYIPDFVLTFYRPVIVEVKPALTLAELEAHTAKIEASGWLPSGDALLVGARLWQNSHRDFGLTTGRWLPEPDPNGAGDYRGEPEWAPAQWTHCGFCSGPSFYDETCCWRCRRCGAQGKFWRGWDDDLHSFAGPGAMKPTDHEDQQWYAPTWIAEAEAAWAEAANTVQWSPPRQQSSALRLVPRCQEADILPEPGWYSQQEVERAVIWLTDILAGRSMPSKDVLAAADAEMISAVALKRAKTKLDVRTVRVGSLTAGRWEWALP